MHKTVTGLSAILLLSLLTGCCGEFFRQGSDVVGLSAQPNNTSIQPGGTQQFTATGTFSNGSTGDVTGRSTWTSSDPAIATIDSAGLATGVAFGSVTIQANCQCYTAKNALTVSSQTVSLTSITVTPANPTISVGKTQQFTATANYSNNTSSNITGSATWSSSDTTIATVTSGGLATGVAPGNTTITASSGTISGTTTLTVQ
jgi:uncharacterized protein YjdB